ncbi:hypothetical protein ACJX0J_007188, partial [Zea mays]
RLSIFFLIYMNRDFCKKYLLTTYLNGYLNIAIFYFDFLSSCIECDVQKSWMLGVVVVGVNTRPKYLINIEIPQCKCMSRSWTQGTWTWSGSAEREMGLNISYNRFLCLTSITNH